MNGPARDGGPTAIEFAPWPTGVEEAHLHLVGTSFDPRPARIRAAPGEELSASGRAPPALGAILTAVFAVPAKALSVRFEFGGTIAFRVLDENGLLEVWQASAPRPARTTFRVRGHGWTRESSLVFAVPGARDRYSHVVATDDLCLEVICLAEPVVTLLQASNDPSRPPSGARRPEGS